MGTKHLKRVRRLTPALILAASTAYGKPDCAPQEALRLTQDSEAEGEWQPGNALAATRHQGLAPPKQIRPSQAYLQGQSGAPYIKSDPSGIIPEHLPFIDPTDIRDHGIILGPGNGFEARFNPTAFSARDPKTGEPRIYMVARAEKNMDDPSWPRMSLPQLLESRDGVRFRPVQDSPIFMPSEWYDLKGGIEDVRYADLRLQPYRDPKDGKTFDGALFYTAYDGSTARVAATVFNHDRLTEYRKIGLVFDGAELRANPLVPDNPEWLKSPAVIQLPGPKGVRNIFFGGEGNLHHGGIMATEASKPMGWHWPTNQKPGITARAGSVTSGLVEPAFRPFLIKLPDWLKQRTGKSEGILLAFHGDSPPIGYSVKYAIYDPNQITGKPLYEAEAPFLWQRNKPPSTQVEKVLFASGAVVHNNRLFVYYGLDDKHIGVTSMKLNELLIEPKPKTTHPTQKRRLPIRKPPHHE